MHIEQIEENVRHLLLNSNQQSFIYDLLLAYGKPKTSVSRLQSTGPGSYNLSKVPGQVLWKKTVLYIPTAESDLHAKLEEALSSQAVSRNQPRFIIVTDFNDLAAIDTCTRERLNVPFVELPNNFAFFLPWDGREKDLPIKENQADARAAEKMAKLFDILKVDNPANDPESNHALNVFLSRVLFCFFAEDTGIFDKDLFTLKVKGHTLEDGSDLPSYLTTLFRVLNTEDRSKVPSYLVEFPYVNGGLFSDEHPVPKFSKHARSILIECGAELNWSEINPDIFGSMIQAVVDVDKRGSMGMHYTSFENIMKVIKPLFLDDLNAEFERNKNNSKRLHELVLRISKIKIFDPACGSGNFLIIAYKELRKLEMEIFKRLDEINKQSDLGMSGVRLSQFYGIELDDFAHEVALLSLWLAEHQMNLVFHERFGRSEPTLPLKPSGNIVCDNAASADWRAVCDNTMPDPVFVLGNPPYLGARNQTREQKEDLRQAFNDHEDHKDSDYISVWLLKASRYISGHNSSFGFVSTNSICQGEQVSYIWPRVWNEGLELHFAYQSFKWSNNAKRNAGVTCVIVGVRNISNAPKTLYSDNIKTTVANISPYLTEGSNICVERTSTIISDLPVMMIGSMARDGKQLIMLEETKDEILAKYPQAQPLFKRLTGTNEFISGVFRWCLWIEDSQLELARSIPPIAKRIDAVYEFRMASSAKTTNQYAKIPHKFAQRLFKNQHSIVVPATSSERREYIPVGYLEPGVVITNSANAIYDASPFVFGIVSSKMHIAWVRSIGGQLETRLRYAPEIVYNTFPMPKVKEETKKAIAKAAMAVLAEREQFPDKSIEFLYDPDTMPVSLKCAHDRLDREVDKVFRAKAFETDQERLEFLFKLYERITEAEVA
ncbi:hypothetical protein AWB71_01331 [Caballeronia peredens]|nr:hypothetical protein AWB71_01331 [Caballeronia peredens]